MGFWMDNAIAKEKDKFPHILVDCGYHKHPIARANADRLLKAMNSTKRNVEIAGFGRILVKIPPAKVNVLKRFKSITDKPGYSWTTHTYGSGDQFDVKFHS